ISCFATGSPPIPAIRISPRMSKALTRSRRPMSRRRSSSARSRRRHRGGRFTSSVAPTQQWSEAAAAYRKAAEKGSTRAMADLGGLVATGSGVAKDEAQARKLFERAAAAGNPRGVTNLAALNESGGAPPDPVKARAWLAKVAETNSAEAQYQL